MKKFFKGLALVLAFALIVASANGFAVKAAKKIKLNKKSVELNVNETAKVKVKNLPAGYTVKFVSKDTTVATVNKKGKITAIGGGETNVVAKIKDAAGKKVANKKCAVAVAAKCEKIALNAPATAVVGAKAFENVTTTPAKTSDEIKYFVDGTEVAADYAYEKAGKYELKVTCGLFEDTAKVEVTPVYVDATDVAQKSATEFIMTMEKEVEKADLSTATITYAQNNANVSVAVKSLTPVSTDKTKVIIKLYSAVKELKDYTIKYNGKSFAVTTASLQVKDCAEVKVNNSNVVYGKSEKLGFVVVNADGVEVPFSVWAPFMTMTASTQGVAALTPSQDEDTWFTAYFYKPNTSTAIKFAFNGYYVENGTTQPNKWENTFVFNSVDEVEIPMSSFEWGFNYKKDGKALYLNNGTSTAENAVLYFEAQYLDEYGDTKRDKVKDKSTDLTSDNPFHFESSDPGIVLIGTDGKFVPKKVGTASILVYENWNDSNKKHVVQVFDVEVKAAREPANIEVTYDRSFVNASTSIFAGDSAKATVRVLDQYGAALNGVDVTAKLIGTSGIVAAGKDKKTGTTHNIAGKGDGYEEFTFTEGTDFVANEAGTVSFQLTAELSVNGTKKSVSNNQIVLTTGKVSATAATAMAFSVGKESIDTFVWKETVIGAGVKREEATGAPTLTIQMTPMAGSYRVAAATNVMTYDNAIAAATASAHTGQVFYGFKLVDSKNSSDYASYINNGSISGWKINNNEITKLDTGVYNVEFYEITAKTVDGTNKEIPVLLKSVSFEVKDSETKIDVEQIKDKLNNSGADISSAFKFKSLSAGDGSTTQAEMSDLNVVSVTAWSTGSAELLYSVGDGLKYVDAVREKHTVSGASDFYYAKQDIKTYVFD